MNIAEPYGWKRGPDPDKEQWKPGRTEHAETSIESPDRRENDDA